MTRVSDGGKKTPEASVGVATTVGTAEYSRPGVFVPPVHDGEIVNDRYRIIKTIGRGGMGVVFLAEHIAIGKPVAIKVLGEDFAHRDQLVERFMQEARAASRIRHDHIVDITDFGFVREGVPYFVMEYLEGQTLADLVHDRQRLDWATARDIMIQICTALQAAHDKGVIHRDMKPDNVFLIDRGGPRPFVKVLDFGIAKLITEGDKNLTRTGTVMGTAAYMSPEQAQSLPLDLRTDIYAAGIVLYEMLCGQVPFDAGGFVGVLTKHITERVPSLRRIAPDAKISAALDRTVLRALHKNREQRYATAAEFAERLQALGDGGGAATWPRWAWLGGGLGLAAAAAAWTVSSPSPPPIEGAPRDKAAITTTPPPDANGTGGTAAQVNGTDPDRAGTASTRTAVVAASDSSLPGIEDLNDTDADTGAPAALPLPPSDDDGDDLPGLGDPATEAAEVAVGTDGGQAWGEAGDRPGDTTSGEAPAESDPDEPATSDPAVPPRPRPPRPKPVPTDSDPELPRVLSAKMITAGLASARRAAKRCGEQYGAPVGARVRVTFSITAAGAVQDAKTSELYRGLPLGRCIREAVEATTFPKALEPSTATREFSPG